MSQTLLHPTRGQENQGYDFQAIPLSRSSIATSGYDLQYIDSSKACWREEVGQQGGNLIQNGYAAEEAFPPRGRYEKKERFRPEDGAARRDVSARRTVRQKETFPPEGRYDRKRRFHHKDGTKRKVAFPPRGWCGEKRNVSTTRMVRRRDARFHHKDGTKKKDSSQQTIIGYVC
jgi:hypothetical protein